MFPHSNFTTGFIYILIGLTAFIDVSNSAITVFNISFLISKRLSQKTRNRLQSQLDHSTTPTCNKRKHKIDSAHFYTQAWWSLCTMTTINTHNCTLKLNSIVYDVTAGGTYSHHFLNINHTRKTVFMLIINFLWHTTYQILRNIWRNPIKCNVFIANTIRTSDNTASKCIGNTFQCLRYFDVQN